MKLIKLDDTDEIAAITKLDKLEEENGAALLAAGGETVIAGAENGVGGNTGSGGAGLGENEGGLPGEDENRGSIPKNSSETKFS